MRWEKMLNVVHAHAEGEVGRVITGGVLDVPGKTMFDKKSYLERRRDWLRRMVLFDAAIGVNRSKGAGKKITGGIDRICSEAPRRCRDWSKSI